MVTLSFLRGDDKFAHLQAFWSLCRPTLSYGFDLFLATFLAFFAGAYSMANVGHFLYEPNKLPVYSSIMAIFVCLFLFNQVSRFFWYFSDNLFSLTVRKFKPTEVQLQILLAVGEVTHGHSLVGTFSNGRGASLPLFYRELNKLVDDGFIKQVQYPTGQDVIEIYLSQHWYAITDYGKKLRLL